MRQPADLRSQLRILIPLLAAYACVLAVLLPRLSLWLDEVLTLIGIRDRSLAQILEYVPHAVGGVPLGFLSIALSLNLLGFSEFAARLPSLVSSVAACAGMFLLARRAGLGRPWFPVLLLALTPLQFRYALEARPYALALAIGVWSTVVLLWLLDRPALGRTAVYTLTVLAGIYTQPLTVFVALAHLAWLVTDSNRRRDAFRVAAAIVAAAAGFVPWYVYASRTWHDEIAFYKMVPHYGIAQADVVIRELVGLGYAGTAVIVVLAILGSRTIRLSRLWVFCAVAPLVGALTTDILFGYFVAIRQMIFVLAPLTLLAAAGIERLFLQQTRVGTLNAVRPLRSSSFDHGGHPPWRSSWRRGFAVVLTIAFLAGCLYENTRMFLVPRENWRAAAVVLAEAAANGACIITVPDTTIGVYRFFRPELDQRLCGADPVRSSRIAVAASPYEPAVDITDLDRRLTQQGWAKQGEREFAALTIVFYAREDGGSAIPSGAESR